MGQMITSPGARFKLDSPRCHMKRFVAEYCSRIAATFICGDWACSTLLQSFRKQRSAPPIFQMQLAIIKVGTCAFFSEHGVGRGLFLASCTGGDIKGKALRSLLPPPFYPSIQIPAANPVLNTIEMLSGLLFLASLAVIGLANAARIKVDDKIWADWCNINGGARQGYACFHLLPAAVSYEDFAISASYLDAAIFSAGHHYFGVNCKSQPVVQMKNWLLEVTDSDDQGCCGVTLFTANGEAGSSGSGAEAGHIGRACPGQRVDVPF
ncbi:hypothetical protein BCV70DRAFT_77033 [Testicularia cyperi]|uniref:Uncharacterized protein n=1 Tax=Testicularia cyperi TaxID=1882483 RepID=A0A317XUP7_9BASI|nr:hypothetical protein BCV70DRAFT_77033 [Testicularia cyperi]